MREAARFIEAYDPRGPLTVAAPGRARQQIQAYLSGCPRFQVTATERQRLAIAPPPPLTGEPAHVLKLWIDYLRCVVSLSDAEADWYGADSRRYYVTIDGRGERPGGATILYARSGVEVATPAGQPAPAAH